MSSSPAWLALAVLALAIGCSPATSAATGEAAQVDATAALPRVSAVPAPDPTESASAPVSASVTPPKPPKLHLWTMDKEEDVIADAFKCDGALTRAKLIELLKLKNLPKGAPVAHFIIHNRDRCELPKLAGIDAVVLMVFGMATVSHGPKGYPVSLGSHQAMRAPGLGVTLQSRSMFATAVVAIATTSGRDLAAELGKTAEWKEPPGPSEVVKHTTDADLGWGSGAFRAWVAFGAPASPALSLAVMQIAPDSSIAEHEHAEWELVSVLNGSGTMRIANADIAIKDRSSIAIPAKTRHAFVAGKSPVLIVQSYAASGPEQRFKKLAEEEAQKPSP